MFDLGSKLYCWKHLAEMQKGKANKRNAVPADRQCPRKIVVSSLDSLIGFLDKSLQVSDRVTCSTDTCDILSIRSKIARIEKGTDADVQRRLIESYFRRNLLHHCNCTWIRDVQWRHWHQKNEEYQHLSTSSRPIREKEMILISKISRYRDLHERTLTSTVWVLCICPKPLQPAPRQLVGCKQKRIHEREREKSVIYPLCYIFDQSRYWHSWY